MKLYQWGESIPLENSILALGSFDAFHAGHMAVLKNATIASFFDPLPSRFFDPGFPGSVRTRAQRIRIFESLSLKALLCIDFSANFSTITGRDFLEEIYHKVSLAKIVTGSNFRLGYRRLWGEQEIAAWAKAAGVAYEAVDMLQSRSDQSISSSAIRQLIQQGRIKEANEQMIAPYALDLSMLDFQREQERIIYNLTASEQVIPPDGSYQSSAGLVEISSGKLITYENYEQIIFM